MNSTYQATTRSLLPLDTLDALELRNVTATQVTYRGKRAVRLVESPTATVEGHAVAIVADSAFKDGIIETELAGAPLADAPAAMRGFVGLAFRVQLQGSSFECFYLRPTNGRADDQLRRNHATQYISHPDYPWFRLREETPGLYESYVDLVTGEWTKIKIVVSGHRAQLYVHGAEQPCLIVNDLKLGETPGQLALWIGAGTEAHFSEIVVRAS